jgi:hypothetical protein
MKIRLEKEMETLDSLTTVDDEQKGPDLPTPTPNAPSHR